MLGITIPKKLSKAGDLVLIPKKDLESLIERARDVVGEKDVLRWSREARSLKRAGTLPILRNLRTI